MARRVAVAVLVLVLGCVAATVHAEPAAAYYDAITTAQDWEIVNGWLNDPASSPLQSYKTKPGAANALWRARMAIGRVPSWAAAGSGITGFTLAAGASLYLGWEIGHASGASDWAYGRVLGWGETAQPQPSIGSIRAYYWKVTYATGSVFEASTLTGSPSFGSSDGWHPEIRYSINGGSTWSTRPGYTSGCVTFDSSPCNNGTFTVGTGIMTAHGQCFVTNTEAAILGALEAAGWGGTGYQHVREYKPGTDWLCDGVYGEGTTTAMARFRPQEQRAYNSTTDAFRKTHTAATGVPKPDPHPTYPSGAGVAAAEAAIEDDPDLGPEVGQILHPSGGDAANEAVTLPQPRLNETYGQYRNRLRALGFLGTITLSENAGVDVLPEFGPSVVTEVQVTTTTGTELYPLLDPWPEPPPTLTVPGTDTDVTIEYNPDSAPAPAPGDPGSPADPPPGNAPPPGGGGTINVGDCSCPGPDFTPITGIDYGDKFPFAVVTIADGLFVIVPTGITGDAIRRLELIDPELGRLASLVNDRPAFTEDWRQEYVDVRADLTATSGALGARIPAKVHTARLHRDGALVLHVGVREDEHAPAIELGELREWLLASLDGCRNLLLDLGAHGDLRLGLRLRGGYGHLMYSRTSGVPQHQDTNVYDWAKLDAGPGDDERVVDELTAELLRALGVRPASRP